MASKGTLRRTKNILQEQIHNPYSKLYVDLIENDVNNPNSKAFKDKVAFIANEQAKNQYLQERYVEAFQRAQHEEELHFDYALIEAAIASQKLQEQQKQFAAEEEERIAEAVAEIRKKQEEQQKEESKPTEKTLEELLKDVVVLQKQIEGLKQHITDQKEIKKESETKLQVQETIWQAEHQAAIEALNIPVKGEPRKVSEEQAKEIRENQPTLGHFADLLLQAIREKNQHNQDELAHHEELLNRREQLREMVHRAAVQNVLSVLATDSVSSSNILRENSKEFESLRPSSEHVESYLNANLERKRAELQLLVSQVALETKERELAETQKAIAAKRSEVSAETSKENVAGSQEASKPAEKAEASVEAKAPETTAEAKPTPEPETKEAPTPAPEPESESDSEHAHSPGMRK